MPHFSTNKPSYTASDRSHAHLIRLHSMTYGEVSWLPLLWISSRAQIRLKSIVATAIIEIMMLAWVTYLGTLSRIAKHDTDTSNIGPSPNLDPM